MEERAIGIEIQAEILISLCFALISTKRAFLETEDR